MLWRWCGSSRATHGFSLVELMIAVAIISILAMISIPNYAAHRHKSVVAAVVGTAGGIRAALASYASDSSQARFPADRRYRGMGNAAHYCQYPWK